MNDTCIVHPSFNEQFHEILGSQEGFGNAALSTFHQQQSLSSPIRPWNFEQCDKCDEILADYQGIASSGDCMWWLAENLNEYELKALKLAENSHGKQALSQIKNLK